MVVLLLGNHLKPLGGRGCETNARQLSSDVPKNQFPSKTVQQLSITDVKMLLLTGKIGKAYKVRNFLIYSIGEIPAIFFKLGAWRAA